LEFEEDLDEECIGKVAAAFVETFLLHRHRGVIDCDDRLIVYGDDGYQHDARSRREVEIVMESLSKHKPVMGLDDEGYSWAVVVTDYSRTKFDKEELTKMVMNAWMVACDEALAATLK
jgi:hypothetical protein